MGFEYQPCSGSILIPLKSYERRYFLMHTIILTGGEGKRLRPITCTMPKPMAPLLNKPTLFYTLELLKRHGLDDVTVAIGYMGGEIKKAVGDGRDFGLHVKYRSPSLRLGTAGSVKSALGNGLKGTVLVMSGDGLTDIDITAARKAHAASGASVTVVLSRVSEPCEYGIAVVDGRGFIKEFKEKPSPGGVQRPCEYGNLFDRASSAARAARGYTA